MSLAIMKQKEVDTLLKEANKMLSDIQTGHLKKKS